MRPELTRAPKPRRRRRRFTVASFYLAVGLAVGYLVLSMMIPVMERIAGDGSRGVEEPVGWHALTTRLSGWVQDHRTASISAAGFVALAGLLMPLWLPRTRYVVWLLAIAVFMLDVALAGAGYWHMLSELIRAANEGML